MVLLIIRRFLTQASAPNCNFLLKLNFRGKKFSKNRSVVTEPKSLSCELNKTETLEIWFSSGSGENISAIRFGFGDLRIDPYSPLIPYSHFIVLMMFKIFVWKWGAILEPKIRAFYQKDVLKKKSNFGCF